MTIEEYTFIVTKLLTGDIIDEVELQSFHWNELYNRPGSAQGTARIDDRTATKTNFASWQNGLWIRQGDQILWGGFMGSVSPISGTRALQIPVFGFAEYFRMRFLKSIQGMTNANVSYSGIQWVNKDVILIAEDMINHAQSFATGNIGVVVAHAALSGSITSQTYFAYEYKPVGVAFEQLADNIAGFDWRYKFDWNGIKPRCTIWLSPIPQGRRTGFTLEYDYDPGETNIMSFDAESSDPPVNGVAAAGSGEGDLMVRTYVADLGTGYPLYEGMISYKDVTSKATLENHAYKHLQRNKVPRQNLNVTIASDKEPKHNEFICGDELLVKVDDGWNDYATFYRVFSKQMLLSKTQDMELRVGLELVG